MTIIEKSKELSARELYNLTMNPTTKKMRDFTDSEVEISCWAIYEDVNQKTGELQQILAIQTADDGIVATNSTTFIRDFTEMWNLFGSLGETVSAVNVITGTSKAGREFITCEYSR